jgi:hypothetical protein
VHVLFRVVVNGKTWTLSKIVLEYRFWAARKTEFDLDYSIVLGQSMEDVDQFAVVAIVLI